MYEHTYAEGSRQFWVIDPSTGVWNSATTVLATRLIGRSSVSTMIFAANLRELGVAANATERLFHP